VFRELSILGSRYSHRAQLSEAAELVATGAVQPVIGATSGPGEVLEIHDMLRAGALLGRGALDWRQA
jgi:D-arabinose 1-dehydrogenase-like Zn-dependent alcohol dehydrogenase